MSKSAQWTPRQYNGEKEWPFMSTRIGTSYSRLVVFFAPRADHRFRS